MVSRGWLCGWSLEAQWKPGTPESHACKFCFILDEEVSGVPRCRECVKMEQERLPDRKPNNFIRFQGTV